MRAVVAVWSSDGSKPSRGVKALAQHSCVPHAIQAVRTRLVPVDVPRVHVPVGEAALDRVWLDAPGHHLLLLGLQVLDLDELVIVDRMGERVDESLLLADVGREGLRQLERAERLLELGAHAIEWGVGAGRDHRPDELERKPNRARLERRQPWCAAERVSEELLVDVHLVAVQLGVDRVAAAAEVDQVEQREMLLELLRRNREAVDELVRRDDSPRARRRRQRAGRRAATAARRSAQARRGPRDARRAARDSPATTSAAGVGGAPSCAAPGSTGAFDDEPSKL